MVEKRVVELRGGACALSVKDTEDVSEVETTDSIATYARINVTGE